jgi:lipopolysaccharide export system protein LptC
MSPAQQSARERMLDGLRRRSPEAIAALARRNGTKTFFKKFLPVAAVLLLVALAAAPSLRQGPAANRVAYRLTGNTTATSASRMSGAKYHGMDQHGQPFTLTANAANELDSDRVALQQPQGDISLKSGAWLELKSDAGLFHQHSQKLGLQGNVTLYRNDGTMMTADAADVDLKQGNASSAAPVQVQGPFGTLNAANGFQLTDRGADVMFNGPATLVLDQAGPPAAIPQ